MTGSDEVSWSQVTARRLRRHHLSSSGAGIAEVSAAICGAHAQVMSAAELSLCLRLTNTVSTDVRQAVGVELIKTYGPRGTVHLLPSADLPMWTGALSSLPIPAAPPAMRMTTGQTEAVVESIREILANEDLTAAELSDEVIARTGSWAADPVVPAFTGWWPRWRQAIPLAAHRGALCFGPNRGRKVTYTNPARLLPGFVPAPQKESAKVLLHQYLHAYGPSTPQHYAQWLAAPKSWTAELFDSVPLDRVTLTGQSGWANPGWVNPGDSVFDDAATRSLKLLPYFDPFQVGCHPRELLFPGAAAGQALGNGQAGVMPVILIGDSVAGIWHLRRRGRKLSITAEPFRALSAAHRRDLDSQIDRISQILGGVAELAIGEVPVGKHF